MGLGTKSVAFGLGTFFAICAIVVTVEKAVRTLLNNKSGS